jgi:hypothetical protein
MSKARILLPVVLAVMLAATLGISRSEPRPASYAFRMNQESTTSQASAEMRRVLDAFGGDWEVSETFEVSESRHGKAREGTASFRLEPGSSLIENYRSDGSAGQLNFLALLWWDPSTNLYRIVTCANNDGCEMRGTLKWEGNSLVNSWEKEIKGKKAAFRDSFEEISPSGFRLVSEGKSDGKTIWRVVTTYTRRRGSR